MATLEVTRVVPVKDVISQRKVVETFPYQSLKPLLFTMQVFGLYHNRHRGPMGRFWQIYSAFICLVVLSSLVRSLFIVDFNNLGFNNELFQKLTVLSWMVWCFTSGVVLFKVWTYRCKGPGFFIALDDLVANCEVKHHCYKAKLRKRAIIVGVLSLSWITINTAIAVYFLSGSSENALSLEYLLAPVSVYNSMPQWGKYICLVLGAFNQIILTAFWCLPIAFNHCVCYALMMELTSFNQAFQEAVDEDPFLKGKIVGFRRRHQQIAKLIEKVDCFLGLQISATLGCAMFVLIFLVYNALWDQKISSKPEMLVTQILWTFTTGFFAAVVLYGGVAVNQAAHESLSSLHDMEVESDQGNSDNANLALFLNKLSGPPIGLTALGLFVINKPSVLTTIGMFVTYFIIVVQFRLPASAQVLGNSTETA